MHFTANRSDLAAELARVQGAVDRRSTIPALQNVLLVASGELVHLTATDLEVSLRASCRAQVKTEGAITLPAKRFSDYIRLLPDGDVEIKTQDNAWCSVVQGRSRMRMAGLSRESFPELPGAPEPLCEIPAAQLLEIIQQTVFAISTEESRFTLIAAQMEIAKSELKLVATDGHRLAIAAMPLDYDGKPVKYLVMRKALLELSKLCAASESGASVRFSADDSNQYFEIDDRLLIAREISGNFPDYKRVLPKPGPNQVIVERAALMAALKRGEQFADARSLCVEVSIENGELALRSSLSDVGECVETLPVNYSGEPLKIGFNADYWLDFLGVVGTNQVRFLFRDNQAAGELRPGTGDADGEGKQPEDRYRYVVMPLRI